MTRETKLGLAVGTSFVALVGVVLFNSWTKTEESTAPPDVTPPVAQVNPSATSQPVAQPWTNGVVQANGQDRKAETPAAPPGPIPLSNGNNQAPTMPTMPPTLASGAPSLEGGLPPLPKNPPSGFPPPPPSPGPERTLGSAQPGGIPGIPPPSEGTVSLGGGNGGNTIIGPPPAPTDVRVPLPKDLNQGQRVTNDLSPGQTLVSGGSTLPPGPGNNQNDIGNGKGATTVPPMPFNGGNPQTGPPPGPSDGSPRPLTTDFNIGGPPPKSPNLEPVPPPKTVLGGANPLDNGTLGPIGPVPPPKQGQSNPVVALEVNPPPFPADLAKGPTVPVRDGNPSAGAAVPVRIGGDAGTSTGPIQVPVTIGPSTARVESHPETVYVSPTDNESFGAVSQRYYKSGDYADALEAFNRDHPLGKDSVAQAHMVKQGARVFVPPAETLQQNYGKYIRQAPQPITPVPAFGDPGAKPAPITPVPPQPPAASGAAPSPAANGRVYVVPAGGKYFYQIAQETLGDGQRWGAIWQLNSNYPPERIVDAGIQIQLPGEAH
jgi:hypothetical protein